jgi:hypothetical protein
MGDRTYTTVLAWPYPGRARLSPEVLAELERHNALPAEDAPIAADHLGHTGAAVLAGDAHSGILAVVDEHANYGTASYAGLIRVLAAAGLHVFARNDAGGDYGAGWEYHPPRGNGAQPERRRSDRGELVVSACDLLEPGERTPSDVPDAILAARTRRLVSYPAGIPRAVLAAA